MTAVFLFLQRFSQDTVLTMLVSTAAYMLIVSVFAVYALGGWGAVLAKIIQKKRES
jgi:hypothetical protein